ncbi:hypothetical protein HLV37_02790 [Eggerthellaceae bacterium zg-1084]|uniref:hypothetical protein n=1 Tax=Berryella wangjianweii TaxID=2734634 RepID=UPI001555864E|nr:hypothetical protein [Berryella wangjianweii]NPD30806.1 hypothetical protein [Berryella wangjianweii]
MNRSMIKVAGALCSALMVGVLATGCTLSGPEAASTPEQRAQKDNRAYMSQLNDALSGMRDGLGAFTQAVSRNDVVSMRTQADRALASIDKVSSLEAPEALTEVHGTYVSGLEKLKGALSDYVTLYTDMKAAIDQGTFDANAFAAKVGEVQSAYDEGMELLKKADEQAAALQ